MSWYDYEKLRLDCIQALKQAGHRNKNRNSKSYRKLRKDKSLVQWQKLDEVSAKKLGYSNFSEWLDVINRDIKE